MSDAVYRIRFSEKSVLEKIAELVKNFNCAPMIKPIGEVVGSLPEKVYEVHLEEDIKPLRVFFSFQERDLTITLAAHGYNEETCQAVVRDFVQDIYKKATDRELDRGHIKMETVGMLKEILCQQCLEEISPSYLCPICNHTYCFTHRLPDRHKCKKTKSGNTLKTFPLKSAKNRTATAINRDHSKVIIKRIPCG